MKLAWHRIIFLTVSVAAVIGLAGCNRGSDNSEAGKQGADSAAQKNVGGSNDTKVAAPGTDK